jgi:hypothetical protein
MIEARCPGCGTSYKIDDANRGRSARCKCGARFVLEPAANLRAASVPEETPFPATPTSPRRTTIWTPPVLAVVGGAFILGCLIGAIVTKAVLSGGDSFAVSFSGGGGGGRGLTVDEFKTKIAWNGAAVQHGLDDFKKMVGEPDRIQEVGDEVYLYYSCKDGELQIIAVKVLYEYQKTLLITQINRY